MSDVLFPQIDVDLLPERHMLAAEALNGNLTSLRKCLENFEAALRLFNFCMVQVNKSLANGPNHNSSLSWSWANIACRDGSTNLHQFHEAMDYAKNNLRECRFLKSLTDPEKIASAIENFRADFPGFDGIRHSVSHHAEVRGDTRKIARHSLKKPTRFRGIVFLDGPGSSLVDRHYTVIRDGQILSYEISEQSLSKLEARAEEFYSAFPPNGGLIFIANPPRDAS